MPFHYCLYCLAGPFQKVPSKGRLGRWEVNCVVESFDAGSKGNYMTQQISHMTQHVLDVPGKTHTHNTTQIRVLCMYAVVYEASVVSRLLQEERACYDAAPLCSIDGSSKYGGCNKKVERVMFHHVSTTHVIQSYRIINDF